MCSTRMREVHTLSYSNLVYEKATPTAMHRVAKLFGLSPVAVGQSKVLEVGCGAGTNIVSLALLFPDSQFLGIDGEA